MKYEIIEKAHSIWTSFIELLMERMTGIWSDRNLSLSQIRLLFVLVHLKSDATISEMAKKLNIGQPAASLLIEGLVKKKLLYRSDNPDDRRKAMVRLTEEGEIFAGRSQAGKRRFFELLNKLDDSKIENIIETLTFFTDLTSFKDDPDKS